MAKRQHPNKADKEIADEIAKDIVAEFEANKKEKEVREKAKQLLKAKGATSEHIDEMTGFINGRSNKTVDEMVKEIVSKFEKKKAVVDEVKKQLTKKSATPEQMK